jgi:tetratricopeptide (TPR) repeat protein
MSDDMLERNVSTLLETGGETPRIADTARARIRAQLIAKHGLEARRRSPLIAVGVGLAATAVAALILTRFVGGTEPAVTHDGSTWIVDTGGKVTVLGERHVRVEGAALLDVAPGKQPFVVDTARGRIEVLGTRFLVAADDRHTTAAVVRGQVMLASNDGSVLLHAGEQGVAEPGRPPTRGPAPRLSHLVSWAAAERAKQETIKPLRNGTLFAREPNHPGVPESPLPIARLGVDIVVEDQVARVALDQTFHNPAPMTMEGMYRFAIPPDAALQRLAMYVDGRLTESAVVERMQARRIYEDVVYRRLDPALLEWAGTGRLALKVYPLPPQQDKRLIVAYTQSVPKLYDDYTITVPLPQVDLPIGELAFDVRVKGCSNCELSSPSRTLEVTRTGDDAIAKVRQHGVTVGDSLVLRVRDTRHQPLTAAATDGGEHYLMVRARPDMTGARPRAYKPRTWLILDDVSASRDPQARRAQTAIIDGFVRELDEDDRVAVVAFDVAARTKLAPTRVRDVDSKQLRDALDAEGGVGATDVGAAIAAALQLASGSDQSVARDRSPLPPARPDGLAGSGSAGRATETPDNDTMLVYVGDGVITSGARNLDALRAQLAGKAHFIGIGVGDGPDTQMLDALAAATGGYATTFDVADDLGWRVFDLVAALHTPRVTGLEAKLVDAGGALVPATTYVKVPQLADGEELELVSRLAGTGTPVAVELTGTLEGAPWRQRVAIGQASGNAGYLPRLWAQRHIAARLLAKHEPVTVPPCTSLPAASPRRAPRSGTRSAAEAPCASEADLREQRDEGIRKEIVGLGKQYFLLSRHTSLLVLEDDAMYARYGVTKGSGQTWAPYALPQKIAVAPAPASNALPDDVAADAELVREPLRVFDLSSYDAVNAVTVAESQRQQAIELARDAGVLGANATRGSLDLTPGAPPPPPDMSVARHAHERTFDFTGLDLKAEKKPADDADKNKDAEGDQMVLDEGKLGKRDTVSSGELVQGGYLASRSLGFGGGRKARGPTYWNSYALVPERLGYPLDIAFDDLTAFVPAMVADASDGWRHELTAAAAGARNHTIDPAARALLAAARAALPAGVYRWDDREIAVDAAHRFGWRRTSDANLAETAAFDGATLTRRYRELGLDVTRAVASDDLALALAYLPIWIADPAHYARWFEVVLKAPHVVTLSKKYELQFDDRDHLIAIRDANGSELVTVTWGASGPTGARVRGASVAVGFTPQPVADAVAWAHGSDSAANAIVELPAHVASYWDARLAKAAAGTAEWRHVQRQRMASFAAIGDARNTLDAFEGLRTHGGATLGDAVLASGGLVEIASDAQFAAAQKDVAGPVVDYLAAARGYRKQSKLERLAPSVTTGLVGALWQLRELTALVAGAKPGAAVDKLVAMPAAAEQLRLVGAGTIARDYRVKAVDVVRAWDAVATGQLKNLARAWAAMTFANRGAYDAAADRVVALVDDLDLTALPPALVQLQWQFQSSRRGNPGWQMVWATWRDKVLAGGSYEHVLALLPLAGQHPADLLPLLGKAAALAAGDPDRIAEVARVATGQGQAAWAQGLVEPIVKAHPTHDLHQLLGTLLLAQGRAGDALAHFEAAQVAGADEAVDLATVRAELAQIIVTARTVAMQASGNDRRAAIDKALAWGKKWRAIDPGNPQIDQQLGEMLLALGETAEAWRQLSTVIERDPMSGDGYQTVADTFERQGRIADALPYWQQAIVIDQTNPTPRLRKAQALIALGRTAEGDQLLAEIAKRPWHARWEGVAYQARELLERGKRPQE